MQHRRWFFTIVVFKLLPGALTGILPIYLSAKKGVFSKDGLTVEVRNEQMNMQALIPVGIASWNASPYSLGGRLKIKDLKELKSKRIAASAQSRLIFKERLCGELR